MILVHSYGKVASLSLMASLASAFSDVFYSHGLQSAATSMIEQHYEHAHREGGMWTVVSQIPTIRSRLTQALASGEEVTVFTGIRDPITRSLSATMELLPYVFTNLVTDDADATAAGLAAFAAGIWDTPCPGADPAQGLAGWGLRAPLFWLADEIEEPFGFDLTAHAFHPVQGFSILSNRDVRLVLFRQENAETALPEVLRQLYPGHAFHLRRENAACDKDEFYQRVSASLKARFRLPEAVLRAIYGNKYVRHYYGGEHAERSIARWRTA